MFSTYLKLGFDHILDSQGYDHILFVIALCAIYTIGQWRKVLILVTAFTIGHSITLALSSQNIITVDADLVEFLIPLTILITAISNVVINHDSPHKRISVNYWLALFFGFIHGLGFSNYFKALLGKEESIFQPLLAFNIGVELGQIIIVLLCMLASYIFINVLKVKQRDWITFISGAAAGIATILILESNFWN